MDKDRADWLEGAYVDLLSKHDEARAELVRLRTVNAELLAAGKELAYYFQCMTDDDLWLIADMMGDPLPAAALLTAIARAECKQGGEEGGER